uniref:Uncharacterized protein MANES_06G098800 n=1 Tax=Rhizophora mucronata TaxID=61149 RepID=A0A2P2MLW7_RHIMU
MSAPDAASDNVWRNLVRSTSVTADIGTSETLSLAHSNALNPNPRVRASKAYATVSTRELGNAPDNEASKILVTLAPRGIITLFLMDKYSSPMPDLARSNTSVKKDNMELDASLQKGGKNQEITTCHLGSLANSNLLAIPSCLHPVLLICQ